MFEPPALHTSEPAPRLHRLRPRTLDRHAVLAVLRTVYARDNRIDEVLGDADMRMRVAQADRTDARGVAADRAGEQRAQIFCGHAVLLAEAHEQARLGAVHECGCSRGLGVGRLVLRLGFDRVFGLARAVTAAATAATSTLAR